MSSAVSSRRVLDAAWLTILPLLLNVISVASTGYIIRRLGEGGWGGEARRGMSGVLLVRSEDNGEGGAREGAQGRQ